MVLMVVVAAVAVARGVLFAGNLRTRKRNTTIHKNLPVGSF